MLWKFYSQIFLQNRKGSGFVSKIKRLVQSYRSYIAIPWRRDAAAAQRVIFCVYNESDELRLRAGIDEFQIATRDFGHGWALFDLTDTFADWLAKQRYAKKYFQQPHLLNGLMHRYLAYIKQEFEKFLEVNSVTEESVVALMGVGSLFDFLKVKDVVEELAPLVEGRLLVFFPGSYENNNYRLLDGYDGWNYLAVPITADRGV
nr:BREX protein BrxB domain-containing protein [Methanosarcina sp. DH1]